MRVYVCDTNNHCVRCVYYDIGQVVTPKITGVPSAADRLMEKDRQADNMIKKRQSTQMTSADMETNLVCEGDTCKPKAANGEN